HISRLRLWNARGITTNASPKSRPHYPSWVSARVSRDSVAVGVLRGQARGARFRRFAALRIDSRQKPCASRDDRDAGVEYAPVWLGKKPFTAQSATGLADFPTRSCGRSDSLRVALSAA